MARLASEAKGGYYPTPEKEMELVLRRISAKNIEHQPITVLDPCCGKGLVLAQIKQHLNQFEVQPVTYGIELEKSRAIEAKDYADQVLACGYEETRISHDSFSFLYLNPPFMDVASERAELRFFRDLTAPDYLMPTGSLVVLNLPQYILGDVAKLVATRLTDVRVYRFTDENYPNFKQVILFGYRKPTGTGRGKELEEELNKMSMRSPDLIPALDEEDWDDVQYVLLPALKKVDTFDSMLVTDDDVLESLRTSVISNRVKISTTDAKSYLSKRFRPARQLKTTHIAHSLRAGVLSEHMGDHLLVGKDVPMKMERSEYDPDTRTTKDYVMTLRKSICRVFTADGHIDLK